MSTLLKSISNSDTTIMFAPDASFPVADGLIVIGTEQIAYTTNYMGTLYGCLRGVNSTTPASHTVGDSISLISFFSSQTAAAGTFTSVTISGLTPNTALTANGSNSVTSSSTTDTELGYVHGVTSAIQTQLNTKLTSATGVTDVHADASAALHGAVQLVSGTNITLSQVGQAITINSSGGSGITQLTGDVTAGPGSGSQAATLAASISGTHTFSGQLIGAGTATNNDAAAGYIGEFVRNYTTNTLCTNGSSFTNIAQISLTAGDWDVTGVANATQNGGGGTYVDIFISAFSGTTTTDILYGDNTLEIPLVGGGVAAGMCVAVYRMSLSTTTTVYLKAASDSTSTKLNQARLSARRVR